ncbi:MAG: hypothetical protein WAV72_18440 [Bradyrhizobium sp.]
MGRLLWYASKHSKVSIPEKMRSVLADDPAGETPVAEVRERILKRIAFPVRITLPAEIFGRVVSQPKAGV